MITDRELAILDRLLDPPDEPEYRADRDWDLEFDSMREDEILGRDF